MSLTFLIWKIMFYKCRTWQCKTGAETCELSSFSIMDLKQLHLTIAIKSKVYYCLVNTLAVVIITHPWIVQVTRNNTCWECKLSPMEHHHIESEILQLRQLQHYAILSQTWYWESDEPGQAFPAGKEGCMCGDVPAYPRHPPLLQKRQGWLSTAGRTHSVLETLKGRPILTNAPELLSRHPYIWRLSSRLICLTEWWQVASRRTTQNIVQW